MTLLVAPMAPHLAEEVWELLGHGETVLDAPWPAWDDELAADEVVTVVVQVNGKLRDRLEVPVDAEKDDVLALARAAENTARFLEGKQVVKEIFVPGKLVNFVVQVARGGRGRGLAGRRSPARPARPARPASPRAPQPARPWGRSSGQRVLQVLDGRRLVPSTPLAASAVVCATPRMKLLNASQVARAPWRRRSPAASRTRAATSPAMSAMSWATALSRPILMSPARSWTSGLVVSDLAAAMNFAAAVASLKVSQKPWSAIGEVRHGVGHGPLQGVPLVAR